MALRRICLAGFIHLLITSTLTYNIENSSSKILPQIIGNIGNVTAAVGKTAKFTCIVKDLNKYNVIWFHVERKMLLVIHKKIVTRIPRFSVIQEDNERWSLQIRNVEEGDKGAYACQVNTEPQLRKFGYLDVVVPPDILDEGSSASTVIVKENGNVTLTCDANGNPKPSISWVREDHAPITMSHRRRVDRHEGKDLVLRKVSRTDMGAYLCIASNNVPPSVSKRTVLFVEFSPIVIVPNQLMSAPLNTSISLECITEAYPRAVIFWKFNGSIVMSNNKYKIEETHENYQTRVVLTITKIQKEDVGTYMCNSRNSFGENGGSVKLHELTIPEQKTRGFRKRPEISMKNARKDVDFRHTGFERSKSQNQVIFDLDRERNNSWISSNRNQGNLMRKGSVQNAFEFDVEDKNGIFSSLFPGSSSSAFVRPILEGRSSTVLLCLLQFLCLS